jgi:hypothetical protein
LYSLWDDGQVSKLASAIAVAALVCAAVGCNRAPEAPRSIDPKLAACVPTDTLLIAGVDLDALRASPLYSKMPAAANAFAAQLGGVSSVLAAYNGKELLVGLRGNFQTPPAGAVVIAPGIALAGSAEQVAAARAQYKSGRTGAPALLAHAESVAAGVQVWIAARANAPLPLTGNAANLAAILRKADFVALTARTGAGLVLELRAIAPDANAASAIEETLRADLTLAAAGEAKRAEVAAALRAAQVTRTDRDVRVTLAVNDDVAGRLFAMF